jgi:DcuC family C4-dicarboxylate transporter
MTQWMLWVGGLVVVATFAAIVRRYETRMVLIASGVLMACLSGKPQKAMDAFVAAMIHSTLVPVICSVMGFAFVMKLTKCDMHLVNLLVRGVGGGKVLLVPAAFAITFACNIPLPSAAGCAAAVGAILIPTLIRAGVHPAAAGASVLAGTWGCALTPGGTHNPFVAKLAGVDVMTVIAREAPAVLAAALVVGVVVTATAVFRGEHKGHAPANGQPADAAGQAEAFRVNVVKAMVPLVPLVLLVLGSKQVGLLPEISVPLAMIAGAVVGLVVARSSPAEVTTRFFVGMGDAYAGIIGLIVAAAVFNRGMELIGLTSALTDAMRRSEHVARLAVSFGPFVIAVLSGSGDAAALAFNGAITPQAEQFGFGIVQMGATAQTVGALGRAFSPVAGAAIVCAQLAGVSTVELTKRNALAMVLGAVTIMLILLRSAA